MKKVLIIVLLLIGYSGIGQVSINEYKYIIVPKRLGEFRDDNQYSTSTLLKYNLVKKGFEAVYEDALPEDLYKDRCLGLTAQLRDNSSMFSTQVSVVLEDCMGQEIFSSSEVKSKEKEYKDAYKEVITKAMSSFDDLSYSYKQKVVSDEPIRISFKNDIKSLESKVTEQPQSVAPKNSNKVVKQTSSLDNQSYKNMAPIASDMKQAVVNNSDKTKSSVTLAEGGMWFAQAIPNGYQLMQTTSEIKMKLLNSSTENVFIGQAESKSGMVFQKDGVWIFEYYTGSEMVQEELTIKF